VSLRFFFVFEFRTGQTDGQTDLLFGLLGQSRKNIDWDCEYTVGGGIQVQYNINGWLDKNKDPIQECVVQLMQESKEPLVSYFFKDPEEGQ